MPRYSKNREDRWIHPHYRKAYVFKRESGMAFTCIDSVRQATGYEFALKNKKAIMQILDARLNSKNSPPVNSIKEHTIIELMQLFDNERLSYLHPLTRKNYIMIFKTFFPKNFDLKDIDQLREQILNVKNSLGLSSNTIRKKLVRLNAMFRFGLELEWLSKSPIVPSMLPVYKKRKVMVCKPQEINLIIKHFKQHENENMALMVEFAYITGMRIQEILDIQYDDIKENELIIHGKGSRERNFPIRSFPRMIEILNHQKAKKLDKPFPWKYQQLPQRYLRAAISNIEAELKKKNINVDMSYIGFHVIRKTTINEWRGKGITDELRNKVMGHTKEVERDNYLLELEIEQIEKELAGKMRVK